MLRIRQRAPKGNGSLAIGPGIPFGGSSDACERYNNDQVAREAAAAGAESSLSTDRSGVISGWADSVVAARGIHLHRFAEMGRTVGECECFHRRPNRAGQIGAFLHRDGKIGETGNREAELIVAHAEIRAAGLDRHVPQYSGKRGERIAPSGSAWRIIHGRIGIKDQPSSTAIPQGGLCSCL